MEFFYSTPAGAWDFYFLCFCCAVGFVSKYSRGMAFWAITAFLIARTSMFFADGWATSFIIYVGTAILFIHCYQKAASKTELVFLAFFLPVMFLHILSGIGAMSWDGMTPWWVLVVFAQMLIILGGAAHGGLVSLGGRDYVGRATSRVANTISRLLGAS